MTRRPNLSAVIAAAIKGGMKVAKVHVLPDGGIILSDGIQEPTSPLDQWKRKRENGDERSAQGQAPSR